MDLLYKFVPTPIAITIIEEKQLRVSRLAQLNDVFDCLPRFDPDPSCDPSAEMRDLHHGMLGTICFSRSWKSPLLWGHYAERGTGVALGFAEQELEWGVGFPVDYVRERPLAGALAIDPAFFRASFLVKGPEWKYEDEVRFLPSLEDCVPLGGSYFRSFPPRALKQIVIGYRSTIEIGYWEHLASHNLPQTVEIVPSMPSSVYFEIVKDDRRARKLNNFGPAFD